MDDDLSNQVSRGAQASRLLDDPIYLEAISQVRNGILNKWTSSPITDKDGQHELRLLLRALDEIEGYIKDVAVTGKLVSLEMKTQEHDGLYKRTLRKMGIRT